MSTLAPSTFRSQNSIHRSLPRNFFPSRFLAPSLPAEPGAAKTCAQSPSNSFRIRFPVQFRSNSFIYRIYAFDRGGGGVGLPISFPVAQPRFKGSARTAYTTHHPPLACSSEAWRSRVTIFRPLLSIAYALLVVKNRPLSFVFNSLRTLLQHTGGWVPPLLPVLSILTASLVSAIPAHANAAGAQQAYQEAFYPSGKLRIQAYVYKPEGAGPFPAVIYNHGSRPGHEREQRPFAYFGDMVAKSGYVVIVPERRGYGRSEGVPFSEEIGDDKGPRFVARQQQEADDVIAAAEFAKTLSYVDGTRIGVVGWSFGGIVSVLAASRSSVFRVVVDQAGGSLSWRTSPALQRALAEAAGQIRVPLLGMVAENDATTQAVKTVVEQAQKHGGNARLIVYPAFTPRVNPNGIAPGHMIFGIEGAHIWERDLTEFLARNMAPN